MQRFIIGAPLRAGKDRNGKQRFHHASRAFIVPRMPGDLLA
jgi:hypothetical protein